MEKKFANYVVLVPTLPAFPTSWEVVKQDAGRERWRRIMNPLYIDLFLSV